mgnify:CR=1 FL=1
MFLTETRIQRQAKKKAHKIPSANWQTLIALYVKLTTLTNQVYPPQYQTETTHYAITELCITINH